MGFPICLYVNLNGNRLRFYTDVCVANDKCLIGNRISSKDPLYKEKNIRLIKILSEVNIILFEETDITTIKRKISEILNHKPHDKKTFTEYIKEYASNHSHGRTTDLYNGTIRKIESFDKNTHIENVDKKWLEKFCEYCSKTMSVNGYNLHLRNIRTVFNCLINDGMKLDYPFRTFKIKPVRTLHRNLSIKQVRSLVNLNCTRFMQEYRDIFMLMIYLIGINSKDLLYLTEKNIVDGRIVYHRFKTKKLYSIKIEPEAEEIMERYKGKNYLLNCMDRYKSHLDYIHHMNDSLKKMGMRYAPGIGYNKPDIPICKNLTTYWSRHTWASLAFELDIPKDVISLALGHSNGLAVTDIYIKYDQKKVDEANRKVIDYILQK